MNAPFNTEAFTRQLDKLSLAMQDNMARALREVSIINAGIQAEEVVQGRILDLKSSLERTSEMKREIVHLLGHHRMPRKTRLAELSGHLSTEIENYRKRIGA